MDKTKRERPPDELRAITYTCYECNVEIGTFLRKKKYRRLCKACISKKRVKRNETDPMRLIEMRFRSSLSAKNISVPKNVDLAELVKRVCVRWENKSVISGEEDMTKLCITGYRRIQSGVMPVETNLILTTSSESITLSKYKTDDIRMGTFSLEVRGKM